MPAPKRLPCRLQCIKSTTTVCNPRLIGVYELLELRGSLRQFCAAGDDVRLRQAAVENGLQSLSEQAAALALNGVISAREAYRSSHCGDEQ